MDQIGRRGLNSALLGEVNGRIARAVENLHCVPGVSERGDDRRADGAGASRDHRHAARWVV
jgi:hypothetical protein